MTQLVFCSEINAREEKTVNYDPLQTVRGEGQPRAMEALESPIAEVAGI